MVFKFLSNNFAHQIFSMYTIHINFEQKGLEPVTLNNITAGDSLLEVLLDNNIELHHNCGGVCACSTCHLYVEKGDDYLAELTDREEDFIDRAVNPKLNSRLGCQCVLQKGSGEVSITLPDQTQFLGE
ncbi:MAG: 2Fe-2S iron-sulfur cluster-binding protein [Chitinophagaceae bacterium]